MTELFLVNNTRLPPGEIHRILREEGPRDAKMIAAYEVTRTSFVDAAARTAEDMFVERFQDRTVQSHLPAVVIDSDHPTLFTVVRACMTSEHSNTYLRQLITQGAVDVNDRPTEDVRTVVHIPDGGVVVKVGKRNWFRVVVGDHAPL